MKPCEGEHVVISRSFRKSVPLGSLFVCLLVAYLFCGSGNMKLRDKNLYSLIIGYQFMRTAAVVLFPKVSCFLVRRCENMKPHEGKHDYHYMISRSIRKSVPLGSLFVFLLVAYTPRMNHRNDPLYLSLCFAFPSLQQFGAIPPGTAHRLEASLEIIPGGLLALLKGI